LKDLQVIPGALRVGTTLRSWIFQAQNKGNHDSKERSVLISVEIDVLQVLVSISLEVQVIKQKKLLEPL